MILREIPKHGIDLASYPGDIVAAHVRSDQHSVIIDRVILIFQRGFIPDAGIDDDLIPIPDIIINSSVIIHGAGYTDLLCCINYKVVIIQV